MSQTLKFKKTDPRAIVPARSTPGAAGYDMCACLEVPVTIYPGETVMIPTGISMEIPLGIAGLIFPRSGMATKRGLAPANKVAVIDPDYRGEIFIALLMQLTKISVLTCSILQICTARIYQKSFVVKHHV